MMNSQRSDVEKISLIQESKKKKKKFPIQVMILPKCTISGSKKSRFIKNQETKGLLSNLGVGTPLSKVPILGDILF